MPSAIATRRPTLAGPLLAIGFHLGFIIHANSMQIPPDPPGPPANAAFQVRMPPGVVPEQISAAILAIDGDRARDLTLNAAVADSVWTLSYTDPGAATPILARFTYPQAPGEPDRTWFAAVEPGVMRLTLPTADAAAPGNASLEFLPSLHGFRFVNRFEGAPLPAIGRALGFRLDAFGLCGGMSFAAADLFLAHSPRPTTRTVPAAGTPLFDTIYQRQLDSFGPLGLDGLRLARWMALPEDTVIGTRKRTYDELPAIRAELDAGRPAAIGLVYVGAGEAVWRNHQVLAFAYEADGESFTLRIYDPNFPDRDDVTIRASVVSCGTINAAPTPTTTQTQPLPSPDMPANIPGVRCTQLLAGKDRRPVRGFFLMPYTPKAPR